MSRIGLRRYPPWMSAAAVAAIVLLAGARLITLSAAEHAAELRRAAQDVMQHHVHLIEVQLQALLERARQESRAAASADMRGTAAASLPAIPARHAFWTADSGSLLGAGDADPSISRALVSEWLAAPPRERATAGFLGPVRYGSQWLVAAQLPVESSARSPASGRARAFAYEALEDLLVRADFGRLPSEGYDFELLAPRDAAARPLLRSRPAALEAPVSGEVRPAGAGRSAGAYLRLAIRPRSGWYPMGSIAAEVTLLALVTWALAFGVYDLAYSVRHARRALTTARERLRAVNARLSTEIEQHDALQRNLEHARYHDAATGLPNRRYFMGQLDRALRELHARRRQCLGIILIEIERFTLINDTLGHTAGDDLLLQAAQRFAGILEGTEYSLARWGADQCVVLLSDVESAAVVRATAAALHAARQELFSLRRHRVSIATRIGFTCIARGLRRPEEALREADVALSVAKRQPAPLAVEYTTELGDAAVSLVNLEADLHLALERGEFGLLFQPIFELRAAAVAGVEALLRWRHPVEGMLSPERFLSIAEETGTIIPVTRWVIQQACRLIDDWKASLPRDAGFFVSVNLSAAALRDPGLGQHVRQTLAATHVAPRYLKFELAERGLIENVSGTRAVLAELRSMGIELMLDDFGTGYSSLSHLQMLPFDYVKIDRPFATRNERADSAVTAAVLQMSSSLGLRSVAELVETEAAARSLAELGCDFAQGYYFSAPLEAAEALQLLRRTPAPATNVGATEAPVAAPAAVRSADETLILEVPPTMMLPEPP